MASAVSIILIKKSSIKFYFDTLSICLHEHANLYFQDVGCQATEKEIKRYTNAEIQQACIMYYGGKSTYNYIRNQNLMKLPSKTTIAERTGHYQCQPGFQKDILKLLSKGPFIKTIILLDFNAFSVSSKTYKQAQELLF